MSKNYFTDEQIREIYYSEAGDSIEVGAFEFYKGLFNKAVEVAIGEPKAWMCEDSGKLTLDQYENSNSSYTPLYSIQELENDND